MRYNLSQKGKMQKKATERFGKYPSAHESEFGPSTIDIIYVYMYILFWRL